MWSTLQGSHDNDLMRLLVVTTTLQVTEIIWFWVKEKGAREFTACREKHLLEDEIHFRQVLDIAPVEGLIVHLPHVFQLQSMLLKSATT